MLKGWTEDAYEGRLNQAHPHSDDQFDAFLHRRASEAIAIYEIHHRRWWQRVPWMDLTIKATLLGIATASWAIAATSIGTLLGAI